MHFNRTLHICAKQTLSATSNLIAFVLFVKYTEITVENHKRNTNLCRLFLVTLKKSLSFEYIWNAFENTRNRINQTKSMVLGSMKIEQQPINVGLKMIYQIEIRIPQIDQVEKISTKHA